MGERTANADVVKDMVDVFKFKEYGTRLADKIK